MKKKKKKKKKLSLSVAIRGHRKIGPLVVILADG
jgi:hypothetical protein